MTSGLIITMYINNFLSSYTGFKSEENTSAVGGQKIFRPWDSSAKANSSNIVKDNSQDSTISTTTEEEERVPSICVEDLKPSIKTEDCKPSFRPVQNSMSLPEDIINHTHPAYTRIPQVSPQMLQPDILDKNSRLPQMIPSDIQNSAITSPYFYPDVIGAPLGLTPSDSLMLSMAQGYPLEEYARVLNQEHQAKLLASKKQRPKKYKCPHCNVGFSNNGQLKGHIRIHTGERPFKCDEPECGKTFTRNEELTRHKRIHSGLRPFGCSHCHKRFGRKDHLKKHSKTHFQPRNVYAFPVMMPLESWATGFANGYSFLPMI